MELRRKSSYYPLFADEETEVQKSVVPYPLQGRSHSKVNTNLGCETMGFTPLALGVFWPGRDREGPCLLVYGTPPTAA